VTLNIRYWPAHGGRPAMTRRALVAVIAVGLLSQTGCGSMPAASSKVGALAADEAGNNGQSRLRSYYVRIQPEATGLVNVDDDGENTFLEFSILPPGEFKFFDALGKPLRAIWVRNMAALVGTHKGVLLRLGTATSYVSINPLAEHIRKPAMVETAQINELRERLLHEAPRKEMEQIAARVAAAEVANSARTVSADIDRLAQEARAGAGAGNTQVAIGATPLANGTPATASAAVIKGIGGDGDNSALPWPRTQRVFFATNSVGITAPDDGLHRVINDAKQSDEIWISGHTDNKGPRTYNMQLAKRRAEAIKYILTSRGVASERIIIVNAPVETYLAANETEVGRAQNRRVDVTFVRGRAAPAKSAGL
jgi:outer membrane protein OmpA-like peptidoglycan-associated protein